MAVTYEAVMDPKPGTYILILRCNINARVQVGRLGELAFRRGYYAYVGSAFGPGGVHARVSRHCRTTRSKHWHIDYLREHGLVESVWYSHSTERLEHAWATAMAHMRGADGVAGFGCSDCSCASHLYYFAAKPAMVDFAATTSVALHTSVCKPGAGR